MKSFLDFPPCKHRFACIQCRNDPTFLKNMVKRFGVWECPEKIALKTPLEKMPQHIQDKIKVYKDRMESKGQKPLQLNEKQTEKAIDPATQQTPKNTQKFTDLPMCKQHAVCMECRNNDAFRERMEQQFGAWECPENIPINTPLEEMPLSIRTAHETRVKRTEEQKKKAEDLKSNFIGLERFIPPEAMEKFNLVKYQLFPDLKSPEKCVNKGEPKQIKQTCCGGTVKMVDGFFCSVKGEASIKICRTCDSFEQKGNVTTT